MKGQLTQARAEIETIKAVATVSENTKQEAIDQVRSQWQEEVASLQAIMKGEADLLLLWKHWLCFSGTHYSEYLDDVVFKKCCSAAVCFLENVVSSLNRSCFLHSWFWWLLPV